MRLAAALAAAAPARQAWARVLLTQAQALRLAFPDGTAYEKKTAYLSKEQRGAAEALAQTPLESSVWTYYEGGGACAYFDRVVVRTMPAVIMTAVDARGQARFVEVLSFQEPDDYLPVKRWLGLFAGKPLDRELKVGGAIRNVTGATLSARAITDSVRRALAVHAVLHPNDTQSQKR
ncbi:MAG TPA: FMN-binding protein [Elusimicrobiota bacterium]|nr:FMN-binding protein [Elusimicrobiota bacterium]